MNRKILIGDAVVKLEGYSRRLLEATIKVLDFVLRTKGTNGRI